jgi:hypothetical protein
LVLVLVLASALVLVLGLILIVFSCLLSSCLIVKARFVEPYVFAQPGFILEIMQQAPHHEGRVLCCAIFGSLFDHEGRRLVVLVLFYILF